MKKFLKIGIALVLAILTCTFILASCGKKDDDKNTVKGEEVSRSEWVKALMFSGVKSYSFDFDESEDHSEDGKSTAKITGTYNNGVYEYDEEYSDSRGTRKYSETEEEDDPSFVYEFSWFAILEDVMYTLGEDEYAGYNEFEYNSKTGAYEAVLEFSDYSSYHSYEMTYYISIKIVDGHVACIDITIEGSQWGTASGGYDETYTQKGTYTFSNVK